ncbi:MAG: isocitrate lyase/PEP mutase family protein [Rhizomicrobium sp.]
MPVASLDAILKNDASVIVPGAFDALSARLAMQAGARAVYMTGFGVAGAAFGVPDIGLVSAAEMVERVRVLASACAPMPLIADGDNGHGGPLNAERLTKAYEAAGAACIQLEDQVLPKRCGHVDGKEVVPLAEAVAKIHAAADARDSCAFKIMARTDARATHGLDEALRRGEAFLKAGADILFVEAPRDEDELRAVAAAFGGVPLVANLVEDGKTPLLAAKDLEALGYKIILHPISALLCVTRRLQDVYAALISGDRSDIDRERVSFGEYNQIVDLNGFLARAKSYSRQEP